MHEQASCKDIGKKLLSCVRVFETGAYEKRSGANW